MASLNHHTDHKKTYFIVWMALLILTVITVWTAYHNYGIFNIIVAMGIATIKASLVCLFFMHLKYDNHVDQVVFVSSFIFVAIFVGLTWADVFYRPVDTPAKIVAVEPASGNAGEQMAQFLQSNPELLELGKTVYLNNCQTCHGSKGQGDGPAAQALNPKPRNFTSGEWRFGGTPSQVFTTVTKGNGGMPSFGALSLKERWAVIHYVRSLSPNKSEDTPETLAAIGISTNGAAVNAPKTLPEIPLDFAIDRLLQKNSE